MRKKDTVVITSSDDEDSERLSRVKRSYEKPKSKSSITSTNPRRAKKPRISSSRSCTGKGSSNVDEVKLAFEEFSEVLNGFKVPAGSGKSNLKELWIDKYKPRTLQELAVHKKKVEEVKMWLEETLKTPKNGSNNCVLIISGQAGVGKSATVHVIASQFGAQLCEWNTPTPTLWQEHLHNSSSGLNYTSKLDEFENFVERVRKYGFISSSFPGGTKSSAVLVIDDLPVISGRAAFERLQSCLVLLVRSTRVPTVILITDYGNEDSSDNTARRLEELQLSLQNVGANKVAFNPITNNSINKTLTRICRQEKCNVNAEDIDQIAKASGGDIRHAITSLQLFCLKPEKVLNISDPPSSCKKEANERNVLDDGFSLPYGRDETLTLFHALGKFLHNKRESESIGALDGDAYRVHERFSRLPLKMDAPEKILSQAHGQARPIADFLHENVLDFLDNEAIDDAWAVASYLGDADVLFASFRGNLTRHNEAENILQSAAASVAVRGVLYGNSHPSASRWHAIRKPTLWQVEQSSSSNQKEMMSRRYSTYSTSSLSNSSVFATEYAPVLNWLGQRTSINPTTHHPLVQGNDPEDESIDRMSIDGQESEISDDEIEDW